MPENALKELGSRIRQVRGDKSQAEFAEELGVHQITVSRWENGRRQISFSDLQKIAQRYGVNIKWLATGLAEPKALDEVDVLKVSSSFAKEFSKDISDKKITLFGDLGKIGGTKSLDLRITTFMLNKFFVDAPNEILSIDPDRRRDICVILWSLLSESSMTEAKYISEVVSEWILELEKINNAF